MKGIEKVAALLQRKGGEVFYVRPAASVYEAIEMMAARGVGALLVMEGERLVGVLSERDLVRHAGRSGALRDARVADLMSSDVATVAPDASFGDCMTLMDSRNVRHLPVVDEDRVVAVLSLRDLLREAVAHHRRVLAEVDRERLTAFHPMG